MSPTVIVGISVPLTGGSIARVHGFACQLEALFLLFEDSPRLVALAREASDSVSQLDLAHNYEAGAFVLLVVSVPGAIAERVKPTSDSK
jgi:hypothetical protein